MIDYKIDCRRKHK